MKLGINSFGIFISALLFTMFSATSCSDPEPTFSCNTSALFSKECATGTMIFLSCYDSWAVRLDETNTDGIHLIDANPNISEEYKIDGLEVKIDACFYEFDLVLLFPDPALWGEMYVIQDFNITSAL